jgi:GAF domain-containing protein/HAMP domain-containing protein
MTEMNPLPIEEKVPAEESARAENKAVRVAAILISGASIASAFYFFIALQLGAWQMYALAVDLALFVPVAVVALRKIRDGRVKTAGWMFIIAMLVIFLASVFLVSDVGLIFGLILVVLVFVTAEQTLTTTGRNRALFASIGVGILMALANLLPLDYRIRVPKLQISGPTLASVILLAIGFFVAIRAWGGNMRNKLLVAFIGVTVVATTVLGAFMYTTTNNNLRDNLERELTAQTIDRATRIGNLFNGQVNALTTLSLNEALQDAVKTQNGSYVGNASSIQAMLDEKDKQWRAADEADNNNDFLVQWNLTNAVARELVEYQQIFPANVEVFATDVYGGLVGATNRTSDFYQADEDWWQAAYNNGEGAVYISEPEFDESAGAVAVLIALPLREQDTGEIIGVLRTTYIVSPLTTILGEKVGQSGEADLYIPGEVITHIREGEFVPVEADKFEALQAVADQGLVEMEYEGVPSVVAQAPVQTLEGNPAVDNLGWVVVLHQQQDEAFAPVNAQVRVIVIVLAVVVALAAAAAYFLSLVLVRPILQLTATAEEVSAGDLDSRAQITTADEVGTLATAFNTMTSRLQETLQGLEQRVADRTQNLELAAEVGRSVSQVRELDVMLKDACELIRKEFDLYYVQVYLADSRQTTLQLQAGTGEVGAQLLERKHYLQLDASSINGRAAVEKRSVVISDTVTDTVLASNSTLRLLMFTRTKQAEQTSQNTDSSSIFRPNPLLPDTRSEMAVPLMVGEKVVGVLDLQSNQTGALNKEVLPAFEALAGQLAVAIQNANLVAETQEARAEVEAQARRLVRTGWGEYMDAVHKPEQVGFLFDHNEVTPLEDAVETQLPEDGQAVSAPISLTGEMLGSLVVEIDEERQTEQTSELVETVARQVAQQLENLRLLESAERYRFEAEQAARRQTREGWQEYLASRNEASLGYLYDLKKVRPYSNGKDDTDALTLPLKTRDETVGRLSVQGLSPDDQESIELANAVAERLGAHIESLRQYDRTQSALAQSEKLFDASRHLTQSADLQELVEAAVKTLDIPVVNRAVLTTFGYDSENEIEQLTVVANWWNGNGHEITPVGTRYSQEVIQVMPMFVSPTPVFFDDTFTDERVDATTMELVKRQNLRAVAVLPLHLGSVQIGALILEAENPHSFTPDETRLFTSLGPQIATVLENRQQYEKAQRQAEREAMLNAINQKIQSATSVEAVLQIAARELGHALGAPMTVAQLSMKDQN